MLGFYILSDYVAMCCVAAFGIKSNNRLHSLTHMEDLLALSFRLTGVAVSVTQSKEKISEYDKATFYYIRMVDWTMVIKYSRTQGLLDLHGGTKKKKNHSELAK